MFLTFDRGHEDWNGLGMNTLGYNGVTKLWILWMIRSVIGAKSSWEGNEKFQQNLGNTLQHQTWTCMSLCIFFMIWHSLHISHD